MAFGNAQYGQGTGAIVGDDFMCTGSEDNLQACSFITNHNCLHSEDAGVSCQGETDLDHILVYRESVARRGLQ